jgi:hypothetical protein
VRERKIEQKRLIYKFSKGKKEQSIRFLMIERKKGIDFVHKKTKR